MFFKSDIIVLIINDNFAYMCVYVSAQSLFFFSPLDSLEPPAKYLVYRYKPLT